jgi:hypothetical protein
MSRSSFKPELAAVNCDRDIIYRTAIPYRHSYKLYQLPKKGVISCSKATGCTYTVDNGIVKYKCVVILANRAPPPYSGALRIRPEINIYGRSRMPGLPIPKDRVQKITSNVEITNCNGEPIAPAFLGGELYAAVLIDGSISLLKTIAMSVDPEEYYPLTHTDITPGFKPRDEIRIVVTGEYEAEHLR